MDSDDVLKADLEKARAECQRLREENASLRLRIDNHHVSTSSNPSALAPQINQATQAPATVRIDSPPELKVSLFRNLFRGRHDVYAVRWEGKNGRTGYSPAGIREWEQAPSARQGHEEIISPQQAISSERGSDQRSSARKANHRGLSSPARRYLLVRSGRFRQEKLGTGCLRILEDVSRDWRTCVA